MSLEDISELSSLINAWRYRDLGQWDKLAQTFHPEGRVEITWFEGRFQDFIEASKQMGKSRTRTKHIIATPQIQFRGSRAVVETNATIVAQHLDLHVGCDQHCRFFDWVEKRDGGWKMVKKQCIYDMGTFTFPRGPVEVDGTILERYPYEYGSLAYLLEKTGYTLQRVFATRGSDLERSMKEEAAHWLEGP